MEKFTVDLEKVLDDFEFSEGKEDNINTAHNVKSQYSARNNITKYHEFSEPVYKRSSFEPINLADADFSVAVHTSSSELHQHRESTQNEVTRSYVFPNQASGSNVIEKNFEQIYADARNHLNPEPLTDLSMENVLTSSSSSSESDSSESEEEAAAGGAIVKAPSLPLFYHQHQQYPHLMKKSVESAHMSHPAPDIIVEPCSLPDVASATKTKLTEKFDLINDRVLNAVMDSSSSDAKPIGFSSIPQPSESDLNKYLDELEEDDDNSVEEMSSLPIVSTDEDLSSSQTDDITTSSSTDAKNDHHNHEHHIENNSEFENLLSESSISSNNVQKCHSSSDLDQSPHEQIIQDQVHTQLQNVTFSGEIRNVEQQELSKQIVEQREVLKNVGEQPEIPKIVSQQEQILESGYKDVLKNVEHGHFIENINEQERARIIFKLKQTSSTNEESVQDINKSTNLLPPNRISNEKIAHVNNTKEKNEEIQNTKKIIEQISLQSDEIENYDRKNETDFLMQNANDLIKAHTSFKEQTQLDVVSVVSNHDKEETHIRADILHNQNTQITLFSNVISGSANSNDIEVNTEQKKKQNSDDQEMKDDNKTLSSKNNSLPETEIEYMSSDHKSFEETIQIKNETKTSNTTEQIVGENKIINAPLKREILNTNYVVEISQPCIDYRVKHPSELKNNYNNDETTQEKGHKLIVEDIETKKNNVSDVHLETRDEGSVCLVDENSNESNVNNMIKSFQNETSSVSNVVKEKLSLNNDVFNNFSNDTKKVDANEAYKPFLISKTVITENIRSGNNNPGISERNTNFPLDSNPCVSSQQSSIVYKDISQNVETSRSQTSENAMNLMPKIEQETDRTEIEVAALNNNEVNQCCMKTAQLKPDFIRNKLESTKIKVNESQQDVNNQTVSSSIVESVSSAQPVLSSIDESVSSIQSISSLTVESVSSVQPAASPIGESVLSVQPVFNSIVEPVSSVQTVLKVNNEKVNNICTQLNLNKNNEPISSIQPVSKSNNDSDSCSVQPDVMNSNMATSPDCYVEEKSIASIQNDRFSSSNVGVKSERQRAPKVRRLEENGPDSVLDKADCCSTMTDALPSSSLLPHPHPDPVVHGSASTGDTTTSHLEPASIKPVRPNSLDLPSSPSVSLSPSETPPNLSDSEQQVQQTASSSNNVTFRDCSLGKKAPFWVPDERAPNCMHCKVKFTLVKRRHHCRACGQVLCSKCCNLKAPLEYLQFLQERVCLVCYELIAKQAPLSSTSSVPDRKPNPNNPMEYCSTVPPHQQAASSANQPPPSVMVPVSVLKREGSLKTKDTSKQVMFSDGVKPGGDLTENDSEGDMCKLPILRRNRLTKRVCTPPGNLFMQKRPLHPDSNSFIPKIGLPPLVTKVQGDVKYTELTSPLLADEPVVKFAIHRNLFAHVKRVHLKCCLGKKRMVWNVTSEGLCCVAQDEIVFVLECGPDETHPPQHIFHILLSIYLDASQGHTVTEMCFVPSPLKDLFGNKDHGGFIFFRPSFQCTNHLILPEPPYLCGVLIHRWEIPWAKLFPLRLILRMGAELKCYPTPLLSIRDREPLFMDIGNTIIKLLADFRSFAYTLPTVRGLVIHMESNRTTVIIPRNNYNQVAKAIHNSNDSHLAFAGNFSSAADSHLVCVQNVEDENVYDTQKIDKENKQADVTGLSFIVFNASLKSADGMSGKTSIKEDGLMVNILPDTIVTLRNALHEMKEFTVECGPNAEEIVQVVWGPNDLNFNVGAKSCIDGRALDGVESIRMHGGVDYAGGSKLIRCTEVFILENSDINVKTTEDPIDLMKKLSDSIAQATCISFISLIDALSAANVEKFAVRVRIHPDDVGYEAGTGGELFSPTYMHNLDAGLVPIIHQAALTSHSPLSLELVFRIMEQG